MRTLGSNSGSLRTETSPPKEARDIWQTTADSPQMVLEEMMRPWRSTQTLTPEFKLFRDKQHIVLRANGPGVSTCLTIIRYHKK